MDLIIIAPAALPPVERKNRIMRYEAVPESLAERFALRAGLVPLPVVDTLFPLLKARSLMAGVRLGIFPALREGPLDAAALAARLGLHAESLDPLLRVLAASGYLAVRKGCYRLSALARRTLLPGASLDCSGYVEFNYTQWGFLERLEDLLRTGTGIDFHRHMRDPGAWESYQKGMLEIARMHAPLLAGRIPVPAGATRLLDIAGSHGWLGAALCRKRPPMRSTVVELPEAAGIARRLAGEAGISDVVDHVSGDALSGDFGGVAACDVALLANILHHFAPESIRTLLGRVFALLVAGGTVAIWDIERPREGSRPELGRDASALFFRLTSESRCFSADEYREWLREAGFVSIRAVRPMAAPLHVLVHARKPG